MHAHLRFPEQNEATRVTAVNVLQNEEAVSPETRRFLSFFQLNRLNQRLGYESQPKNL